MNKLESSFKNHKNFIAFVTANDPNINTMVNNVCALAKGGADIVEIGIPFSDPIADGPVIQRADVRALKNNNLSIKSLFQAIKEIKTRVNIPIVFLTYLNIVLQYGYNQFCHDCDKFGVNGLIIPDLPYEEKRELSIYAVKYNIALIPLITLNSKQRIKKIANDASGFIYLVSSLGVTGERNNFSNQLSKVVNQIRKYTNVPVAIGFGIHSPVQAQSMAKISDGAIIGSACVKIVEKYKQNAPKKLEQYANSIKTAIKKD